MLLTPKSAVPVDKVPVGSFFYIVPQAGEPRFAFMAEQKASTEGSYSGPVVLTFPTSMADLRREDYPRKASNFLGAEKVQQ